MVAPLIGLLGIGLMAGAGSALLPHIRNYQKSVAGDYNRDAMRGIDPQDLNATRGALFGAGLIEGPQFLQDARQGFQDYALQQQRDATNAQADRQLGIAGINAETGQYNAATSRLNSGIAQQNANTSSGNLALQQAQFLDRVRARAADEAYKAQVIDEYATPEEKRLLGNNFSTTQGINDVYGNVASRQLGNANAQAANQLTLELARGAGGARGAGFGLMSVEDRTSLLNLENQVTDVNDAVDYFSQAGVSDRVADGTAERFATQFLDATVAYQQEAKGLGALQEADLEFVREITADPNSLLNLSSSEQQKMKRIANVMKRSLRQRSEVTPYLYETEEGQQQLQRMTTPYEFPTVSDTGRRLKPVERSGTSANAGVSGFEGTGVAPPNLEGMTIRRPGIGGAVGG